MPQPAARVGDQVSFGGALIPPGVMNVLIEGRPAANMVTMHVGCPMPPPPAPPHPPMPGAMPGSPTVLIGGAPAIRMGDTCPCGGTIIIGAATVLIGP
jgi:uncharacterized Zn-binding protein involved in type VI secretion